MGDGWKIIWLSLRQSDSPKLLEDNKSLGLSWLGQEAYQSAISEEICWSLSSPHLRNWSGEAVEDPGVAWDPGMTVRMPV